MKRNQSCWNHRAWDEVDDLYHRAIEILKMGFKVFAYHCPDCKKERHAFFSEDAIKHIVGDGA